MRRGGLSFPPAQGVPANGRGIHCAHLLPGYLDWQVNRPAASCSFGAPDTFCRHFDTIMGISPAAARDIHFI